MITSAARICARHRRLVIAAWAVLVALVVGLAAAFPAATTDDYTIPGSASESATALLEEYGLHDGDESSTRVVVHDPAGLEGHEAELSTFATAAAGHPDWEVRGEPGQLSETSDDGRTAYLDITLADRPLEGAEVDEARAELDAMRPTADGLQVVVDGDLAEGPQGGPSEGAGMLVAAIVLFLAFGSLMAMVLPLAVAIVGAVGGVSALALAAHLVDMSSAATPLAAMVAVGVGIDYALLVVTRFREELAAGRSVDEAIATAYETAGHSVAFAGTTVVVAVLGLLAMAMPLVSGIAIGVALAVLVTMLASLTLLPAVLRLVGTRIDRFGLPFRRRRQGPDHGSRAFARWGHWVQRHRWAAALGSLALLVAMTVPALSMRLGFDDGGALPTSYAQRQAHDLVAEGFGPGHNGALVVALDARGTGAADREALREELGAALESTEGVAEVSGPFTGDDDAVAAAIVVPTTAPDDPLVQRLRGTVLPGVTADDGASAEVVGTTAAAIDYAAYTVDRLPLFVGVVLLVSIVLLMAVFRSVLVPLKAALVNVLSIGASFGLVVAIVQWGWLGGLLGFQGPMPVTAWVPMMMVAVVFGLSMDYEVFLLSRVKELFDEHGDNAEAVAEGLARTGRVITAAALIMVSVFGGFVLGDAVDLKVFGLGLALAVLIDATIVRMVLVPATLALMGRANWWLPRWLDRLLPRVRA